MSRWRVFRERVPESWKPMWIVWDDHLGEWVFPTGGQALGFVHWELTRRGLAQTVSDRRDSIVNGLA